MPNFPDITPTWMHPIEEEFNVITTPSENIKKEYFLLSATPLRKFRMVWSGVTDGDYAAILQHWRDVSGPYASFTLDCVPSYINGGSGLGVSMTGRYVGKPKWEVKSKSWDIEVIFEKAI